MGALRRTCLVLFPLLLALAFLPSAVASADGPVPAGPHASFAKPAPQGTSSGTTYRCKGGIIPPGVYESITVSGICYMPSGNILVRGSVTVAAGALLDAVSKGDPTPNPVVPAVVTIDGSVTVGQGAVFLFGCSPNITCTNPPGITYDHIKGSLIARGAQAVNVHSATISGNVSVIGGGGGAPAATCAAQRPTQPLATTLEPWSEDPGLYFIPVYSDFEDSQVGGNFMVSDLTSCWLGTLRDQVRGNATIVDNTMGDPDAMEVVSNVVGGNMTCRGNDPAVQFGESEGAPSVVGGYGLGECAFTVTKPNPAPGPTTRPGPAIHVTVSRRALRTYTGTYSSKKVASLTPVTTSGGDTLLAELGNFRITGTGLTGGGKFNPTLPPGQSGYAQLVTVSPNGAASFTIYLRCHCTFQGLTGNISIRVYGTTAPTGASSGTFLISSGGNGSTGTLKTLAGYGTFWSSAATDMVHLVEHLAFS